MVDGAQVLIATYLAQAIAAALFGAVLRVLYRLDPQQVLLAWSWSCLSFCAFLVGEAVLAAPVTALGSHPEWTLAAAGLTLVGGTWQLVFVVSGTVELITRRTAPQALQAALAGLALASLALPALIAQFSPGIAVSAPLAAREFAGAVVFAFAGLKIWRWRPRGSDRASAGLGQRSVALAFLLFGASRLVNGGILALSAAWPALRSSSALLAPVDFLFQALIGLSAVAWLLEAERQRVAHSAAQIEQLAYQDTLTGLPNRNFLLEHLERALAGSRRRQARLSLLFVDLDRFKAINDSLGYGCGDSVLRMVAARLREQLPEAETLARVGGDEFVALLTSTRSEEEVSRLAEHLLDVLRVPYRIDGRELCLSASCGVSRFPEDGDQPDELLNKADIAMYRSKIQGRDHWQIYSPSMSRHQLEQLALENDLRKAIAANQLVLFYQPILDSRSEEVVGLEALLRWRHPQRGLLAPGEFLWLAELAGLGSAIDQWALRTACRQVQLWNRDGLPPLRIAVNLSARPFQRPDLLDRVKEALAESGLPPARLELEITETLAMHNPEASLGVLGHLKELGIHISIDDFGTGYSSLSYLTNFPIDTLKVDASFVRSLGNGRESEEVVAAIIALAHSLHIAVVAEGVELDRQLVVLRDQGCDKVQGYLFSEPLPADQCRALLRAGGGRAVPLAM
jgi:diguanylate cyclase (GGDEF)-like protein